MLLYDGDCGFCSRSVRCIQTGKRPVEVAPYQRVDLQEFGLTREQLETQAFWVGEGAPVGGAAAIAQGLRAAGGARAALGRALLIWPISAVARSVYGIVARNRHRLSRSGNCALPSPPD